MDHPPPDHPLRETRPVVVLAAGLLACALVILPSPVLAQEAPPDVEALQARIAELEERIRSLRREHAARLEAIEERLAALEDDQAAAAEHAGDVEAAPTGPEPDPGAAVSDAERRELEEELAGILGGDEGGAAGAGDGGDTATPAAPVGDGDRQFTSRTRNLNQLNPEISVAGDIVGAAADRTGDPSVNRFRIDEFEAAFQSTLDPYSTAKAFIVNEEGEFELEEAYIDYTSLPGRLGLKIGQMRSEWGKINRWHQHALPQVDRPLVHQAIWGERGLKGLGVGLSWLPPNFLGDYNEVTVQVVNDQNDAAFSGKGFDNPVFVVHETNYFDLTDASYLEIGLSAANGANDPDNDLRTQVYGVDWNFNWVPPERSLYRGFEVRGEMMWERRDGPAGVEDYIGTYTYGTYKLNRRWSVGVRGDWTEIPGTDDDVWGVSPYIEWWQSEWAMLRFQYSHNSRQLEVPEPENKFFFQIVWALGPHKHEKY